MTMETAWLALLGFLLAGYFVLGGYDYGVQMLRVRLFRDEEGRRVTLRAFGPFFLGNEVWLVAFVGVLFGAFPFLEGTLLSGLYPLLVAIVAALVVGNAAVQLRSRATPAGARVWDVLVACGGVVPAVTWGLVVGVLLAGVPSDTAGTFTLTWQAALRPFVLLCGATTLLLFAAHGATFLALRLHESFAERARRAASPLLLATVACTLVTAAVAALSGSRLAVVNPGVLAAVATAFALTLAVAWVAHRVDHAGAAFAATSVASALPVLAVGAGQFPYVLVSSVAEPLSMTVTEGAADGSTLGMLTGFGVVLVPVIVAYQLWSWYAYRGRVDGRTPGYF